MRPTKLRVVNRRCMVNIDCDIVTAGHVALDGRARFTKGSFTSGFSTSTSGTNQLPGERVCKAGETENNSATEK